MFCCRINAFILKTRSILNHVLRNLSDMKPNDRMARGLPKKIGIAGVQHVVLVASAKGGVGKSCVSVNLALALKHIRNECEVGLLDADVFGPSLPRMMSLNGSPKVTKQNLMQPLTNYGIKCMSMGFLVDENSAIVWRGLMVMQAIEKLLRQVAWGPLDYLIIDMPPGTGDTQLSIAQNIPVSGAVIVTTPQDIALLDARRGVVMFNKTNVQVLGVVQNMSVFVCNNCGHEEHIFGHDGAKNLAKELNIDLLGDVPLEKTVRECCDSGQPVVLAHPQSKSTQSFISIASKIMEKLSKCPTLS